MIIEHDFWLFLSRLIYSVTGRIEKMKLYLAAAVLMLVLAAHTGNLL